MAGFGDRWRESAFHVTCREAAALDPVPDDPEGTVERLLPAETGHLRDIERMVGNAP